MPEATRLNPPLTDAARPLALFSHPPLTEEYRPLARLTAPPLTADWMFSAMLLFPPPTHAASPVAALFSPPLTDARREPYKSDAGWCSGDRSHPSRLWLSMRTSRRGDTLGLSTRQPRENPSSRRLSCR